MLSEGCFANLHLFHMPEVFSYPLPLLPKLRLSSAPVLLLELGVRTPLLGTFS